MYNNVHTMYFGYHKVQCNGICVIFKIDILYSCSMYLLRMEGQISVAINCIFTEWSSDRDHVIWGSEVMGEKMYDLLFSKVMCTVLMAL